ncbi:DNA adenine methylase [Priestia megaterium]|uniref:DNA adenine methylase n=1 Tax=Priestia megaterium TaxID=1404 RepID=UPI000EF9E934|nr:DNA adenine methylase [Priestia megaterium]RMA96909.1 DNA adenine methylase [Priestia megaterium]
MTITTHKIPQLLKWIGNKHRFANEIVEYMPERIDTYFEPFLGSGAVLATLSNLKLNSLTPSTTYNKAIASDALQPLVRIFDYVKKDPSVLIDYYREHIQDYNEDKKNNYEKIKERFNVFRDPLDFLLLTRTCYSGIIRFRKRDGYMSTPVGPHNPISPDEFEKRVMVWHHLLQETTFVNSDYKQSMRMAGKGDLVYCDPPYTHSQTIIYGAQAFNINELFEEIQACKDRGAKVMLSINGVRRSGTEDIGVEAPQGLFEREILVNCGISMINRLQREGKTMINEDVHDKLLLTW